MLSGGWRTVSGKRTFLLITPEIADGDDEPKQITFDTIWAEAPEDVLAELGLERLFTDSRTNSATHVLSEAEARVLMAGLVEATGVDVLAAPSLAMKADAQGRIAGRESKAEGESAIPLGPHVELTPVIRAGGTLDLTVNAQFSELNRIETATIEPEPEAEPEPAADPDEEDDDEP